MVGADTKERLEDDPHRARLKATRCAEDLWKEVTNASDNKLATEEAKTELARIKTDINKLNLDLPVFAEAKAAVGIRVTVRDSKIDTLLTDVQIFKLRDIFASIQTDKLNFVAAKNDGPLPMTAVGQINIRMQHLNQAIVVFSKHNPVFDLLNESKLHYEGNKDLEKIAKAKGLNEYAEILGYVISGTLNNSKYKNSAQLLSTKEGRKEYIKEKHPQVFAAGLTGFFTLGGLIHPNRKTGTWSYVETCINKAEATFAKLHEISAEKFAANKKSFTAADDKHEADVLERLGAQVNALGGGSATAAASTAPQPKK